MDDLPANEYESYAPHIVSLIAGGTDDAGIAAYLLQLRTRTIGASSNRDLLTVAADLRHAVAAASDRAG